MLILQYFILHNFMMFGMFLKLKKCKLLKLLESNWLINSFFGGSNKKSYLISKDIKLSILLLFSSLLIIP